MRLEVSPAALTGTGNQVRARGTELGNASQAATQTLTGSVEATGEPMVAAGLETISAAWGTSLTLRAMAAEALGGQATPRRPGIRDH